MRARLRKYSTEGRARADAWLDCLGISGWADRDFSTLSSGEQKVVLLAREFARRPALLVLDEPFQGLDVVNKERMRRVIVLLLGAEVLH